MTGLKEVSKKSQNIKSSHWCDWMPIYYSIDKDRVYTQDGEGRFHITDLIRPCTPEEIEKAVKRCMAM